MTHYGMAVPAALLLVSLSIPSAGQTTDDTAAASNYVAPGQTPVQVTAPALPAGQKQLTQEELAGLAGASRATVNGVLREAEKKGLIELERGKTRVMDREELARRAR